MAETYRLTPDIQHATIDEKIEYLLALDAEVMNLIAEAEEAREEARAAGNSRQVARLTRQLQKLPPMLATHEEVRQRLLKMRAH